MILVDGSHTLHRARFVADETISKNPDENSWKAYVYIFARILFKSIQQFKDRDVYILWDKSGSRRRQGIFPDHKKKSPIDTSTEEGRVKSLQLSNYVKARQYINDNFHRVGVTSVMVRGVEADDIAYYVVNHLLPDRSDILLLTGDKDWHQSLRPGVTQWRPMEEKLITYDQLANSFPFATTVSEVIEAHRIVRAFVGKGNEVPGVSGIGEGYGRKFAEQILKNGHAWSGKGKIFEKARKAYDDGSYKMNYDLVDYSQLLDGEADEIKSVLSKELPKRQSPDFMTFIEMGVELNSSQFGNFHSYLEF